MKIELLMQPIRFFFKGRGCFCSRLQRTATVMVINEAQDFLNRKKLIAQTFLKMKIQLFRKSQLYR